MLILFPKQAIISATASAQPELIHTGAIISNGAELPLLCRKVASIVGKSCIEAVFITTKITISSLAVVL